MKTDKQGLMTVLWPKLFASKLNNKILLCLTGNMYLLLFFNPTSQQDVLYKKKTHSLKFVHSGTKKSTLQLIYLWPLCNTELLFCLTLITCYFLSAHLSHKMQPCLHSCYQRQGVIYCICTHIGQMWFTNCDADLVKWYLHEVHDTEIAPTLVLCSSEAWFCLSGYVTSRNNRYGSAKISY
jgi:hypothetical protein